MTTTATRERPILFSGPMVRAILDGRKSQTRRVVKFCKGGPFADHRHWPTCYRTHDGGWGWCDGDAPIPAMFDRPGKLCPYGQPGDRLWVREAFCYGDQEPCDCPASACRCRPSVHYREDWGGIDDDVRWRPSIHMPRWACRLTLEVMSVRVQRVQDINEWDAVEEGRSLTPGDPRGYFPETWDEINGKRGFGWDANPWVWAVKFKVVP